MENKIIMLKNRDFNKSDLTSNELEVLGLFKRLDYRTQLKYIGELKYRIFLKSRCNEWKIK